MKHLLLTGFDPFGGAYINPAWEAVRRVPDTVGDCRVERLEIPTVFGLAADTVIKKAEEMPSPPDIILCIGQAGGRASVTPELIAINHRNASIPDNAGNCFHASPVLEHAPAAYFSTLPVYEMAAAVSAAGIPAAVSYSAGTFVCNDTLFLLLHHFRASPVRVGFVHVPFLPEQLKGGAHPSMPLDDMVSALIKMIEIL